MTGTPDPAECRRVRELLPELALGVASGEVRARALRHLVGCAGCRRRLEDVTAVVDELLLLSPEQEPPPGFDSRVLAALEPDARAPRRHRLRSAVLVAAAVALVASVSGGVAWQRGASDRELAADYRDTLSVADGRYFSAADLTAGRTSVGTVFAYDGSPSWLFMTVRSGPSGDFLVRLTTQDGRAIDVGWCRVRDGSGAWGTTVDVPVRDIARVDMVRGGRVVMVSQLQ